MIMSKFKAGDKVRCVDNSCYHNHLTVGKVYTVLHEDTDPRYVRIKPDHGLDEGGYGVKRFILVQGDAVLTPEEVFEHLRKGTKLQIKNKCITPRDVTYNWVDIGEDFMVDLMYDTICTKIFRIKPEPEVIELNGKKYREIVE